jgi:hypothetical protein
VICAERRQVRGRLEPRLACRLPLGRDAVCKQVGQRRRRLLWHPPFGVRANGTRRARGRRGRAWSLADQQGDHLPAPDRPAGCRVLRDHSSVPAEVVDVGRLDRGTQLKLAQLLNRSPSVQPGQIFQVHRAAGGDARRQPHYS